MMNKSRYLYLISGIVLSFLVTQCAPGTQTLPPLTNTPIMTIPPDVQVQEDQVGPYLTGRKQLEGQRLELSPSIQFTFDREMDQTKTERAFKFIDPDSEPVPGKISWPDPKTLSFEPASELQPSTVYKAIFADTAAGKDGQSLQDELQIVLTTIDLLAVAQVFPIDKTEDIDPSTTITVIFNHPVVPLRIEEEQTDLPQPLTFTPELTGEGDWVNSSVYVFQPEKPLLSGTNYKVRVDPGLVDTTGDVLEKPYTWYFSTRFPVIVNYALKNGAVNPSVPIHNLLLDQAIIINFLQPMDPDSVREAVTLVNRETGRSFPIKLTWNEEFTALTIEPVGRYMIASFYDLDLADTALASDGGRLKEGLHLELETLPLPRIIEISPKPYSVAKAFDPYIEIQFVSPMRLASLKERIKFTPEPDGGINWYFNENTWKLYGYGLKPATGYIVRILPGMSDIYGNTIQTERSFTFTTGDRTPYARLVMSRAPLIYRAEGPQEVYFEYINLDSATLSVYPLEFSNFTDILSNSPEPTEFVPRVAPILEWEPDLDVPRNEMNSVRIKLEDRKENPLPPGYYFIGVEGTPLDYSNRFYQGFLFIVASDNITLKTTSSEALAWVTDLESGKPQSDIKVRFYDEHMKEVGATRTDKNGLAYLDGLGSPAYAEVDDKGHFAFAANFWGSGIWAGAYGVYENYYSVPKSLFGYLYSDRPVYRPGQDVFFKGIIRENDDLHYSLSNGTRVYVTIEESGERVFGEYISLSELGSFDGKLTLAEDAALGTYTISARQTSTSKPFAGLTFRVAEYHKPVFEVVVSSDKSNFLAGEQAKFNLDASYYSGGGVGNAGTEWFIESTPYYFQPAPRYRQFNILDWDRDIYWSPLTSVLGGTLVNGTGITDADGHLEVTQTLGLEKKNVSQMVTFQANISDVAGNLVSGSTSVIVHQCEVYAGIRSLSYVGKQGQEQSFEVVVLDWDSSPVANQDVTIRFTERQWYSAQVEDDQGQLRWETSVREISMGQQSAVTDEEGKATVSFVPPRGGVYKALVSVRDSNGNTNQASAYTWVSSTDYIPWKQTNDRTFNLIVDKDGYSPGDTAEILIAQPFDHPVYALVTYERGHIYKQDVVLLSGNSTIYRLPITSEMAPISYVSVVVVSGADASGTPDFKIGMTSLNVDTSHQKLDVTVTPDRESAGPGDQVKYMIETKDHTGMPVSADVSLAVVDKAVLALAPANSSPILDAFYAKKALGVRTSLGIVLNAEDFNARYRGSTATGQGAGGGGGGLNLGVLTVRQDFKDTAYFDGQVVTGQDGKAEVTVTMPQNLTTWQADVRAATADSVVGQTTQDLLSTKPLFIEMQTPRFFVNGDQALVGATIHNNTGQQLSVKVSLDADGVDLTSPAEQSVDVLAGQQAYIEWGLTVKSGVERVDFTVRAVSGEYADASKPALGTLSDQGIPVYDYVTTETVGTSGMLQNANSATEAVQLPSSLEFSDARIVVEVSPSLAASLQDGLTYLEDYPYLCLEQTVSRFLPNVITLRALKNAGIESPVLQRNLDVQVNSALQRIYALQKSDGGWSWWDGARSDPQTTAYVVYGLLEAQKSGFTVSENVLAGGLRFLSNNVSTFRRDDPKWQYNRTAFILYVLAKADELQPSQTNFIYEYRIFLSLYGKAYLAQALHLLDPEDVRIDSLLSDLETATVMSSSGAHWEESFTDFMNWNTDTRTTAIVLDAFAKIDPDNPITANAVRWLMAHRESGHWNSTQETAWSLIALTDWMTTAGEYDTRYAYAVGLNGELLEEGQATKDNLIETVRLQILMKDLLEDSANYLVFSRGDGTGNLYYTAYLNAELPVESLQPLDQGMGISRQYFSLDDPRTPITSVARGELVRVRLTVVAPSAMHYIVVNDPLPAGLEAVDASIQTDTAVPVSYSLTDFTTRGWGWWYFSHVELRDEKVVLSADYLPAGTYVYSYLARAGTSGTFKVIPPTASEFYFPDVAGRGAGSLFVVTE